MSREFEAYRAALPHIRAAQKAFTDTLAGKAPASLNGNAELVERTIRELAGKLYHHAVTKYDPAAAERCIATAIAALSTPHGDAK